LASPRAGETAPTETAPRYFAGGLPATKNGGAATTKARYSTAATETSILLIFLLYLLLYILLHIANRIRRAKHKIITGRFRLASVKLQKTNQKRT
jgi:hypothetical protein